MGLIRGRDILVFADNGNGYEALAYGSSCRIQVSVDMFSTSSKASGRWEEQKPRRLNWSCSSDNLCGENKSLKIFNMIVGLKPVRISFALVDNVDIPGIEFHPSGKERFEGMAYITNLEINAELNSIASMSMEFAGSGELEGKSDYYSPANDKFNYELPFRLG